MAPGTESPYEECDSENVFFTPQNFPSESYLTVLDVSNSNLSTLSESIKTCFSLHVLKANSNSLVALPEVLGQLKGLRELHVSSNKLSTLPFTLCELPCLELLNLSYNEFCSPPACLQVGCVQITYLDFSHNHLKEWTWMPMCVYALKTLNLAYNNLQQNLPWIWTNICLSLENLDLSNNDFQDPAYGIDCTSLWNTGVTERLQYLNLSNCGLSSNSLHFIFSLKYLKKLNMGNNNSTTAKPIKKTTNFKTFNNVFWKLPFKSFGFRMTLIELLIPDLGLSYLPDDLGCLEALEILDCQNNELNWLPDSFSLLLKLRVAVFSSNKLLYLPEDFGKLQMLEELWLDNNKINLLPHSFCKLKKLCWLDLFGNEFESCPLEVQALASCLFGLDMGFNYFDPSSEMKEAQDFNPLSNYSSLEKAMREHPQLGIRKALLVLRSSYITKPMLQDEPLLPEISETTEDSFAMSFVTGSGEENIMSSCAEELWDCDDEFDDSYDPCSGSYASNSSLPLYTLLVFEAVSGQNSFCPCDIHPLPAPRASMYNESFGGQFEDA